MRRADDIKAGFFLKLERSSSASMLTAGGSCRRIDTPTDFGPPPSDFHENSGDKVCCTLHPPSSTPNGATVVGDPVLDCALMMLLMTDLLRWWSARQWPRCVSI